MNLHDSIYQQAYKGDYSAVKVKVDDKPDLLTTKDENERYLTHWAALGGHADLVQYLVEKGSPLDLPDDVGTTPLVLAASAGREEVVHILISRGANVNHQNLQGHSALQYSCSKGWKVIARMLLQNGANINIADKQGATPLHRAASQGKTEIVKVLLLEYCDDLNLDLRDNAGNTALHLACEEDRQEEAKLLVSKGAKLELRNKAGKTPLDVSTIPLAKYLTILKATVPN